MNRLTEAQLADIHSTLLEMLLEVDRICKAHGLRYTLYCGTLLGAVRDGGFIPWDDDADLAMPLRDYRRFRRIARKEMRPRFELQDIGNTSCHPLLWMQMYAVDTAYFRPEHAGTGGRKGIFLDIYPFVGAAKTRWGFRLQSLCFIAADALRHIEVWDRDGFVPAQDWAKRFMPVLRRLPRWFRRAFSRLLMGLAMRSPARKERIGTLDAAPFAPKYAREDWDEFTVQALAGHDFPVPARYDALLTTMYGDWRTPPPPSARGAHGKEDGSVIVDARRSYREYERELLAERAKSGGNA